MPSTGTSPRIERPTTSPTATCSEGPAAPQRPSRSFHQDAAGRGARAAPASSPSGRPSSPPRSGRTTPTSPRTHTVGAFGSAKRPKMPLRKRLWRSLSTRSSVASLWRSAATATASDRHPNGCDPPLMLMRQCRRHHLCRSLLLRPRSRRHRLTRHRRPRPRQLRVSRSPPSNHLRDRAS